VGDGFEVDEAVGDVNKTQTNLNFVADVDAFDVAHYSAFDRDLEEADPGSFR
jgi:hypothetical protein